VTDTLESLRHSVSRVILALIWVQVPIAIATAVISGNGGWAIGLLSLAVAVVATLSWWRNQASQATRLVIGVALIASLSLIVAAAARSQVQIDLHMAYFAELALLTAYCDRNVVIAGAGMTAVDHLLLNFLVPVFRSRETRTLRARPRRPRRPTGARG
jgi:methyl-accepting chemotaxis protein